MARKPAGVAPSVADGLFIEVHRDGRERDARRDNETVDGLLDLRRDGLAELRQVRAVRRQAGVFDDVDDLRSKSSAPTARPASYRPAGKPAEDAPLAGGSSDTAPDR